jgi:hypothetical protein
LDSSTGLSMTDVAVLGEGALSPDALAAANVHPDTGLATDYLNHFNEVVMLLEMLPDMPDFADEVLDWQPVDYEQHFENTNYVGKETVIAAYRAADHALKAHLETIVAALNDELEEAQSLVRAGDHAGASAMASGEIESLLAAARAAVQGRTDGDNIDDSAAAQADVDALFG